MSTLTFAIYLAIAFSGLLLWFLLARQKPSNKAASPLELRTESALLIAKHYRYFPQIRQALSADDAQYLKEKAPPRAAKQALRERRAVARRFIEGLHEDFSNLARLGRIIAALSPEVSREQETERLILSLKFQMVYALVWLRLFTGNLPIHRLEHLTGLVGRLAARMEEAMTRISALSAGQLPGNLSA